jgi:hypothetical protein
MCSDNYDCKESDIDREDEVLVVLNAEEWDTI